MITPKGFEPMITGDCAENSGAVARYRGLGCSSLSVTWGLRPRLYAVVRYRGLGALHLSCVNDLR
jgi:hypothetical protein